MSRAERPSATRSSFLLTRSSSSRYRNSNRHAIDHAHSPPKAPHALIVPSPRAPSRPPPRAPARGLHRPLPHPPTLRPLHLAPRSRPKPPPLRPLHPLAPQPRPPPPRAPHRSRSLPHRHAL